ncbi:MAG: FAD:protein FMN transferase [Planctomycetota bacterium]
MKPVWLALLGVAFIPSLCQAQVSGSAKIVEQVYLTRDAALQEIFGSGASVESYRLRLSEAEQDRIQKRLRRRLFENAFTVYRSLDRQRRVAGYAVITEEIGKYQPITFIVAITSDGKVQDVAVMAYRESHGGEVRRRRFLRQFVGKSLSDPLRVNRDIINISGATLSARSLARGVKKVLYTVDECLLGDHCREEVDWRPVSMNGKSAAVETPLRRVRYLMGTVLHAVCYGERARTEPALRRAFAEVARLEKLLSTYLPKSEISRVNRDGVKHPVRVSEDTFACIEAALCFARGTDGAFDPTLVKNGYRSIALDPGARSVHILRKDLQLDLGGIGKGYALDRAAAVLRAQGVNRALLNFGGQVLALDPPPGAKAWLVGIRAPHQGNDVLGTYEVVRASVSTSAAYERGHHVINLHTGLPATTLSATVCVASATAADALSTALDVLGSPGLKQIFPHLDSEGGALVVSLKDP